MHLNKLLKYKDVNSFVSLRQGCVNSPDGRDIISSKTLIRDYGSIWSDKAMRQLKEDVPICGRGLAHVRRSWQYCQNRQKLRMKLPFKKIGKEVVLSMEPCPWPLYNSKASRMRDF